MLIHEGAKSASVTGLEHLLDAVADVRDRSQALEHYLIATIRPLLLVAKHEICVARVAGEEEQEMLLEVMKSLLRHRERRNDHAAVQAELKARYSAERGYELVLFANSAA